MAGGHTPQRLPGLVERCQALTLTVRNVEPQRWRDDRAVGDYTIAIRDAQNLHDPPVVGWNPDCARPIVIAGWHSPANASIQEVLEVGNAWLVKLDAECARSSRLIDPELHRLGVTCIWRQFRWHGFRTTCTNRIFTGSHMQC